MKSRARLLLPVLVIASALCLGAVFLSLRQIAALTENPWPTTMPPPPTPQPLPEGSAGCEAVLARAMSGAAEADLDTQTLLSNVIGPPPWEMVSGAGEPAEVHKLLDEALICPGLAYSFVKPVSAGSAQVGVPRVTSLLALAHLRLLRGWHFAEQERPAAAMSDFIDGIWLGSALRARARDLLGAAVGSAILEDSIRESAEFLAVTHAPEEPVLLASLAGVLSILDGTPSGLPDAIAADCAWFERTLLESLDASSAIHERLPLLLGFRTTRGLFYDPDKTVALHRQRCASLVEAARTPWSQRQVPHFESLSPHGLDRPLRWIDNPVGRLTLDLDLVDGWKDVMMKDDIVTTRLRVFRVEVAIMRYHRSEGRLPMRLQDLVPGYLDKVPADPFADGPLGWDPQGAVVSSRLAELSDAPPG